MIDPVHTRLERVDPIRQLGFGAGRRGRGGRHDDRLHDRGRHKRRDRLHAGGTDPAGDLIPAADGESGERDAEHEGEEHGDQRAGDATPGPRSIEIVVHRHPFCALLSLAESF